MLLFKDYKTNIKKYQVGALMYTPATNTKIANKLIKKTDNPQNELRFLDSLVFCLEDAITLESVHIAEQALQNSLQQIEDALMEGKTKRENLPLLFIRVRTSEQLSRLYKELGECRELLTGFVLPKFDTSNSKEYISFFQEINQSRQQPFYAMPVLETLAISASKTRINELENIKHSLSAIHNYILNIRVGGNDLCGLYGLRRNPQQSIYDIMLVRSILEDILNQFSLDYIVSGPVWEYFGTDRQGAWAYGLKRELELDILNGFIGKTAIHPTQLELIHKSLKVDRNDFKDANNIINWNNKELGVAKSSEGTRMNEVATHYKWAEKILALAEIYGIKDRKIERIIS